MTPHELLISIIPECLCEKVNLSILASASVSSADKQSSHETNRKETSLGERDHQAVCEYNVYASFQKGMPIPRDHCPDEL